MGSNGVYRGGKRTRETRKSQCADQGSINSYPFGNDHQLNIREIVDPGVRTSDRHSGATFFEM